MSWRTVMLNPRRCCMCRRRVLLANPRYLGMRAHPRCIRAKCAEDAAAAPFWWVQR